MPIGQSGAIDPLTPVIVGVGQFSEAVNRSGYTASSPADLAERACVLAAADSGVGTLLDRVDVIAAVRQFDASDFGFPAPLGRTSNFPRSVTHRLGIDPERAILDVSGGQSPQSLVSAMAREIAAGRHDTALVTGAEAISTGRHFAGTGAGPDFTESPGGDLEDRGAGLDGMVSTDLSRHGIVDAASQYALLENARRGSRGVDRERYLRSMAELFAPFSAVAAENPFAASPVRRTADELAVISRANRLICDPYPRYLVARDQVNQAAAVLMTSWATARAVGVSADRCVVLHGSADAHERAILDRPDLGRAPAAVAAVRGALMCAGAGLEDISFFDLYSCFPIAVSALIDGLGIDAGDPRGFTLTGGLPFFGGPGNNYSLHAIAEAVRRTRDSPGTRALVCANGGVLSKFAVGIYSSAVLDAPPGSRHRPVPPPRGRRVQVASSAAGPGKVETYTVRPTPDGPRGVVIGRLDVDGRRFVALADPSDDLNDLLAGPREPLGVPVMATSAGGITRVRGIG